MTIQELIDRYHIFLDCYVDQTTCKMVYTGKIRFETPKNAEHLAAIKANKAEIVAALEKERDAWNAERQEYREKIDAIEGLKEIESAQAELEAWQIKFERSFYGPNACGGLDVPPKPKHDIDALRRAYPRADAYLKADHYSCADHDVKAKLGRIAMQKIIDGEDYVAAINEMENKWSDYCINQWD